MNANCRLVITRLELELMIYRVRGEQDNYYITDAVYRLRTASLCFCFVFLRLVHHMLPVSLDCSFLIVPSVFSNIYLIYIVQCMGATL